MRVTAQGEALDDSRDGLRVGEKVYSVYAELWNAYNGVPKENMHGESEYFL